MSQINTVDDANRDELYTLATLADIEGRSDMTKDELFQALDTQMPHLLRPFSEVTEAEEGDKVAMNHLSGTLTVKAVEEIEWGEAGHTRMEVVMETIRGGLHKVVTHKSSPYGKNGAAPHLERWRAGDEEWMYNSDDPIFFLIEEKADDEE